MSPKSPDLFVAEGTALARGGALRPPSTWGRRQRIRPS